MKVTSVKHMKSLAFYLRNPRKTAYYIFNKFSHLLPDRLHLKLQYRMVMGVRLNLKNPRTFCEKIQWLKLNDRKPEYTMMVDKLAVKQYVSDVVGNEYVIPVLGVWDRVEDINFDLLPNSFVMKTSHGGGSVGVYVCKDKEHLDKEKLIAVMSYAMKQSIYKMTGEWPYKNVKKCIFAERYMSNGSVNNDLADYKWYCFDGEPCFCQVIQDRRTVETIDFFDKEWNHQEFIGLNPNVNNANTIPQKPENLKKHIELARKLSKGIPFCRVDLYEICGKTYFGEITFYPASGLGKFNPDKYNTILGDMIKLPTL